MKNFGLDVLIDLIAMIFFCADNKYVKKSNKRTS